MWQRFQRGTNFNGTASRGVNCYIAKASEGYQFYMEQPPGGFNLYVAKASEACQFLMEQPPEGVDFYMAKALEGRKFYMGQPLGVSIFIWQRLQWGDNY